MAYITATEYNLFAWTSWQDALITELIANAEAALNTILRITTFDLDATYTELVLNKSIWPYYLNESNINSVEKINDVAIVASDYLLEWRRLQLLNSVVDFDTWWRIKIWYTAWYARTPTDLLPQNIKTLMYYMVSWLLNSRKNVWISEWSQWQLRIKFASTEQESVFKTLFTQVKSKYIKNDIYS